jgi:NADPH:quinone reductase-like Zn-dependent oxidoreductase
MKAILLYQHGGPDVLKLAEYPIPEPGPSEVRVRLRAAALNHMDIFVREGWPGIKLEYPHILGADGAGEVESIGQGVTDWNVGTRVVINANLGCGKCKYCLAGRDNLCRDWRLLGETVRGTYAEYVTVPARQLLALPTNMDYQTAAAAGLVFHTAWHSLVTRGTLQQGETVLIIGASGGVNTASIQIAKYIGAKVIVIGAGPEKLSLAESLGADILIDREKEADWSKSVYLATEKRGVDVVVDNVGTTFPLSFRTLRKGGRLLTVGNTGGPRFEIDNRFIFGRHLTIIGSTMGTLSDFAEVMTLVFTGKLRVACDRSYPLAEAGAAQERLAKGKQLGKITLEI